MACELLSESGPIHDKIIENDELLSRFFSILQLDAPHSTLLGYFSKTALVMIGRNPEKMILFMVQEKLFGRIFDLLYSKALVDILLRVLIVDIGVSNEIVEIQKQALKATLKLLVDGNELVVVNATGIVCELLARVPDINCWKELVMVVCEADNMKLIYDALKHEEEFRVTAAATVLKALFGLCVKVNLYSHFPDLDINSAFIENLPILNQKLQSSNSSLTYSTMKTEYQSLGESRLRIIELISLSLKQDNEHLYEKLSESNILRTITQLFFDYPWHSILHSVFDSIIQTTLLTQNPLIVSNLLINPDLIDKLIKVCENPDPKHRYGHLGYIHKLCNNLKNTSIVSIQEFLAPQENWQQFVANYLNERNSKDLKQLGEVNKNDPSSSSEEPEILLPDNFARTHHGYSSAETHKDKGEEGKDEDDAGNDEVDEPDNIEDKSPTGHIEISLIEADDKESADKDDAGKEKADKDDAENENNEKKDDENVEGGKLNIEIVDENFERPLSLLENSPLNKRRRSGSESKSPNYSPFACANYWKIEILADEVDGMELEQ